ncbi:N(6)-L-threonylcarbamoyladenine synthase Kae1 [archaeon]|nr:MAG: N(6)-L-threonylcarbamoyladenine synthase Kae1 [archaeon]
MICLGIESTAHTFGIGIVNGSGKILANAKDIYKPNEGYGIIPMEAAKHHSAVACDVLKKALDEAKIKPEDVDIIAYSAGPGLPPYLRAGAKFAETLSARLEKELIPANHCVAHIEIGKLLARAKDPVTLYVSGGNTQIIAFAEGRYRIFGETLDVGIGNALDQFARDAGLDFPGGPKIEQLAKSGKYIRLPYTVKGMDLSFSGIITEALRQLKKGARLEDVCFSLQETAFAMLVEVTERAVAHTGKNEILLTGGVAANKRLQEMLEIMCKERGAKFFTVPRELAGDNGAMIAWAGILAYRSGENPVKKAETNSRWRTDEVDVKWIKHLKIC